MSGFRDSPASDAAARLPSPHGPLIAVTVIYISLDLKWRFHHDRCKRCARIRDLGCWLLRGGRGDIQACQVETEEAVECRARHFSTV